MAGEIAPAPDACAGARTSGDTDLLLALYAEDGVYEEIPTNTVASSHDEIRAFFEGIYATFSDIEVTPTTSFQTDTWALSGARPTTSISRACLLRSGRRRRRHPRERGAGTWRSAAEVPGLWPPPTRVPKSGYGRSHTGDGTIQSMVRVLLCRS